MAYIFQILSLVLSRSDSSFQHNSIPRAHIHQAAGQILEDNSVETSHMAFLTSQTICIVMCSSPLVAFIFLSLLHNLMLTFEQVQKKTNTPNIFQSKLYSRINYNDEWYVHTYPIIVPEENIVIALYGVGFKPGLHADYGC